MYGQMTAGSFCYIGPQGIVHGTTVSEIGSDYGQHVKKAYGVPFTTEGMVS